MTEREPRLFILVVRGRLQVALSFLCLPVMPAPPYHARPPLSFPRPPSVLPAVFSGNPQVVSLPTAETQTAGFPIKDVGNDRKRATPFHSCCERSSSGHAIISAPSRSCPRPPSVIPAVFSGNPQVGSWPTAETQTAGFPINNVGNDRKRAVPFHSCCGRSSSGRAVLPAPPCPSRASLSCPSPSVIPAAPPLSFPQFLAGIHKWDRCRRRNKQTAGFPINNVGNDRE